MEELVEDIGDIMTSKVLTRAEVERLRGRLQFASSQVFGRKFRRLLKTLSNHVSQGRKSVSDHTMKCLEDVSALKMSPSFSKGTPPKDTCIPVRSTAHIC